MSIPPTGPVPAGAALNSPIPARAAPTGPVPAAAAPNSPVPAGAAPTGPVPADRSQSSVVSELDALAAAVAAGTAPPFTGLRCKGLEPATRRRAIAALDHPAADYARAVMQVAAAGTGVRLSGGSTNVLPAGRRDEVVAAWRLHSRLVPAARLLSGLGPASRAGESGRAR